MEYGIDRENRDWELFDRENCDWEMTMEYTIDREKRNRDKRDRKTCMKLTCILYSGALFIGELGTQIKLPSSNLLPSPCESLRSQRLNICCHNQANGNR